MTEYVVIGAGVAGLAVATELTARGAAVRVLDRAGAPGPHHCSWWAGGMLAPFCEFENAEEPVLRLGRGAADWWARHAGGVTTRGTLVVAPGRDRAELRRFARRTEGFEEIAAPGIAALEPDLEGRFPAGLFFEDEAHLSPRGALAALVRGLADKGVEIERTEAPDTLQGPGVIDCRGLGARDALPDLRGVKGEMLVLHCPDLNLTRPVRMLHPRIPLYVVPRGDGIYMLGATMIEAEAAGRFTVRSALEMLSAAYAIHPGFGEAEILETGVDARPAFPDNLPRIRRAGGRLHANGLHRHGFLLAPALAAQVADHLLDGATPEFMDHPAPKEAPHAHPA
ncbi:glycine oxidase ThiO [Rhodovulum sp. DZ06]|uniref:glycine oxidase ThiO n=1 Tax=Rhodovulum sp. DZ06 TaxID=3425126 RepID=UPI003D352789